MAKKRKAPKRKAAKKPPADWDTLFADSVLDVVAGEKGVAPEVNRYENMLDMCAWVKEAVGRLSAKLKAESGWAFRLRQEHLDAQEVLFCLLLVDGKTQAILERLARLQVARYKPNHVVVRETGGDKAHSFTRGDFESGLSGILLSPDSTLRRLLVWKLSKKQRSGG